MAFDKRWRLVCYDIREPARWRKVYKIIRGGGTRVQYSIFRCRLDKLEVERLRWQLAQVMAAEDALLIVDLCPTCASNVISRNHVDGWQERIATYRVIGVPVRDIDQAPESVDAELVDDQAQAVDDADEKPGVKTE